MLLPGLSILSGAASQIDDPRSPRYIDHALLQLLRQKVYQAAAGYKDCNDRLEGWRAVEFSPEPPQHHEGREASY
jgi:hypothetical protein